MHAGFEFGGKAGADAARFFVFCLLFKAAFQLGQGCRVVVTAFASKFGQRACFFDKLQEIGKVKLSDGHRFTLCEILKNQA